MSNQRERILEQAHRIVGDFCPDYWSSVEVRVLRGEHDCVPEWAVRIELRRGATGSGLIVYEQIKNPTVDTEWIMRDWWRRMMREGLYG